MSLSLGAGVEGFTNAEMAATADTGAAWGLHAWLGTRTPIALGFGYSGSAQDVDAFGLDTATLVGTAIEGDARFNAFSDEALSPYVMMGIAFRRYDLTRYEENFSDVSSTDHVIELPIGAGFAYRFRDLVLDAKVQLRVASNSDLVPDRTAGDDDAHLAMHRWGVGANLGVEF